MKQSVLEICDKEVIMKTFKQWMDSLPEPGRNYVFELSKSFDRESPTYYACDRKKVQPEIMFPLIKEKEKARGSFYHRRIEIDEAYSIIVGFLLDKLSGKNNVLPDIDDKVVKETIQTIISYQDNADYIHYLPLDIQRQTIRSTMLNSEDSRLSLRDLILLTEDFDDIPWHMLDIESYYYIEQEWYSILPTSILMKMAKARPASIDVNKMDMNNEMFDTLFFLEDGWSPHDKKVVMRRFPSTTDGVANFMERIVAVDKSYLRYLPTVLKDAGLARALYSLKKPSEEITEGMGVQDSFRYSREYRRLFMIVRCCNEKHMSKEFARKIGDASALVKLYDYDYNTIFEALYPEYAA